METAAEELPLAEGGAGGGRSGGEQGREMEAEAVAAAAALGREEGEAGYNGLLELLELRPRAQRVASVLDLNRSGNCSGSG